MTTDVLFDRLGWEVINVSLEYTAVAWLRYPRLLLSVAAANLLTHPLFAFLVALYGRQSRFVFTCEICIVLFEWLVLSLFYRDVSKTRLLFASLLMNTMSFGVGLLLLI